VTARARDAAGNQTISSGVMVTVKNDDSIPPSVAITSPTSGVTVSSTVTVTASASDNIGVSGIQFLVDGLALGAEDVAAPYSTSWNTTTVSNGTHAIAARARDGVGNQTTSTAVSVTVSNGVAPPPPPAGLLAAYGFEEGTGTTTADATGRNQTGTLSGATWSTAGRFGKALSFNGTSSRVNIADSSSLHLTAAMTLEAWVRPTTVSGSWRTAILKESSSGLAYALYAANDASRPAGYVRVGTADTGSTASAAISLNVWTHLATTFDGSTVRLYVNGTLVSSVARSGTPTSSTSPLRIGGNAVWGEYFAGLIDEVRIYNRVLTAAEIQTDMNTPVSGGS
jgi:hypothetical protein